MSPKWKGETGRGLSKNFQQPYELEQPGNIPALVLPSGSMAARHRKGATAEQYYLMENKLYLP
ncbi:hypothetical protein CSKR_112651 [Clonorchis sinensis]|uniref:Uncharacterized protein n=1 Tax=Clonorchis sinensis TaxID=79923 RepID=A0A3R7JNY7_CLOSI|nr:hypothetical protein CSKR_112651 [Clonorchis sinensis]